VAKKKNRQSTYNPPEERVEAGLVDSGYELLPRDPDAEEAGLHDEEALDEMRLAAERAGAPFPPAITTAPSDFMNPYVSEEEQGMEMRPAIVGPPAYGSPDPLTSAGRLLPIEQHPLRADALPEGHPAAISEDYGEGYDHTLRGSATVQQQPNNAASDLERHSRGDFTQEQLAEANEGVDATDGARELAEAEGVDLNEVNGTGADGRVTKDDVESFLSGSENA
jgi:pyruvate/2-oxoglutarate dehydrogenase complex dihydrolipoamide acyltransferase (E2) component